MFFFPRFVGVEFAFGCFDSFVYEDASVQSFDVEADHMFVLFDDDLF